MRRRLVGCSSARSTSSPGSTGTSKCIGTTELPTSLPFQATRSPSCIPHSVSFWWVVGLAPVIVVPLKNPTARHRAAGFVAIVPIPEHRSDHSGRGKRGRAITPGSRSGFGPWDVLGVLPSRVLSSAQAVFHSHGRTSVMQPPAGATSCHPTISGFFRLAIALGEDNFAEPRELVGWRHVTCCAMQATVVAMINLGLKRRRCAGLILLASAVRGTGRLLLVVTREFWPAIWIERSSGMTGTGLPNRPASERHCGTTIGRWERSRRLSASSALARIVRAGTAVRGLLRIRGDHGPGPQAGS